MSESYSVSAENQKLLNQTEALKKIYEHNRDFLSVTLTIPLGNTALKKVHTNQWLFMDLPKELSLANFETIANALNSSVNRFSGYVPGRWYIEAVDISVEADGKAEMKLTLNAYASSISSYTELFKGFTDAYTDAVKSNESEDNNDNSNATSNGSVINEDWVKKYNVPSEVVNKIKEVCSPNNTLEANVKAWFNWMDNHISWADYYDHQRSEATVLSRGSGNCVDNSRLFRAGCLALGAKCNYIRNSCISHQYNKVYLNGKGIIVDTGRQLASWGSHWGSSGCPSETETSW